MIFKAAGILFSGEILVTVVLFFRNFLVARLISVEDMGIAATFAMLFAAIEVLGNVSLHKLVVQHPDGDAPRFIGTVHAVQLLRGILAALATLALARPYADFVNTPDIVWAYQVIAVLPLARGFVNLDLHRMQRTLRFLPFAVMTTIPPLLSLLVVVAVWLVSPDWQVMLWAIVAQQLLQVVFSHILAERRFTLAWDPATVWHALRFGAPLMVSGVLFFLVVQGDRMIVANQLGPTVLGWFSITFLLVSAPTRILSRTTSALFLPTLSAVQSDAAAFRERSLLAIEMSLFTGLVALVGMALFGPALLVGMFGQNYAPGLAVLTVLAAGQAVFIARGGPNAVALATGRTSMMLQTGVIRTLALPIAWWALNQGYGVVVAALIALAFEIASFGYGMWLASRLRGIPLRRVAPALAAAAATLALVLYDRWAHPPTADLGGNLHGLQIAILAAPVLALAAMPRIWRQGLHLLRRRAA